MSEHRPGRRIAAHKSCMTSNPRFPVFASGRLLGDGSGYFPSIDSLAEHLVPELTSPDMPNPDDPDYGDAVSAALTIGANRVLAELRVVLMLGTPDDRLDQLPGAALAMLSGIRPIPDRVGGRPLYWSRSWPPIPFVCHSDDNAPIRGNTLPIVTRSRMAFVASIANRFLVEHGMLSVFLVPSLHDAGDAPDDAAFNAD